MTGRDRRVRTALEALFGVLALALAVAATAQQGDAGGAADGRSAVGAGTAARAVFGPTVWIIESVVANFESVPISAEAPTELALLPDLPALAGTAGCNRMTARFDLDGFDLTAAEGRIEFSPITATLMACPEPAMTQERGVFAALEDVTAYRLEPGRVELRGPGAEVVLVASAADDAGAAPASPTEFAAFNQAVAAAAAAGANWPRDPLRVALAFVALSQAPQTTVSAAVGDVQAVVTVVESGFLDDSVAGVTRRVSLAREGTHWRVTGAETVWQCARGPGRNLVEPRRCP